MPVPSRSRARGWAILSAAVLASAEPALGQALSEAESVKRALSLPEFEAAGAAERDVAAARIRAIGRFDNPEAVLSRESVSGSAGRETEWRGEVVQPIDLSGERGALRAAARAEARATGADVLRRRQQRAAEVREAYAGCAAANEKAAIAERFVRRLREAERIITLRTRAGDTAAYDLRRLRVEARSAEAEAALAGGEIAAECATFSRLVGLPQARPASSLEAMLATSPVVRAQAALSRQDLVAREARVEAATQEVRAARRSRLPDVSVGAGYKRISAEEGSAGGPMISLGARIPIFNSGSAAVAEARARQRLREAELALARREVEASIAAASARASAAMSAASEAREAAADAARLGTIAEAAYEGGETGVVELVDAYRTARDAELKIVDLTERAVRATITFNLAEGRE